MKFRAFSYKENSQKSGAAGFTLIELMVCLSVITILGCAAVSSFKDYRQKANLKGAAFQLFLAKTLTFDHILPMIVR